MSRILQQIGRVAAAQPDALALRQGDSGLSYAQLLEDVERVAQQLRNLQTRALGIYLDNGVEWIVLDLAALAAAVRIVPLPWFFSEAQIRHAIEAGAVDQVAFATALPSGVSGTGVPHAIYRNVRLQAVVNGATRPGAKPTGVKLSFTSGSTRAPKGIELEAAFIEQCCVSICQAIPGAVVDVHLSILPYATLLENLAGVYVPLMLGKCVVAEGAAIVGLLPDLGVDPDVLAGAIGITRPASLILTPQLLELLCVLCERGAVDPACFEFVAVGGARVGEALLRRAHDAGIPAYEGYGLTEFASVAILNTPTNHRLGSVGKPLPGVRVSLAEDGEIRLATDIESRAGDTSVRREIVVATGDYGSIDADGFVYVNGRKSNLIVLANGRNVSPEWIETELVASPAIRQAFVFDSDETALSALLVVADPTIDNTGLEAELERINENLPAYARIRYWHRMSVPFTRDNGMLTANGRLRRAQIRALFPLLITSGEAGYPDITEYHVQHSLQENHSCH